MRSGSSAFSPFLMPFPRTFYEFPPGYAPLLIRRRTASYGLAEAEGVRDAGPDLRARHPDRRALLAADALGALPETGEILPFDRITLLPPIPNPDKILCIGLNYMAHIKETGRKAPSNPSIFTRYPSSLVGHGVPLERPKASGMFDYEGELAVIIGRPARHISAERAMEHVAGWTAFNDGSIRDFQRHTSQFWPGKSFDRSGAMGPWLVTADESGAPADAALETRLNGETVQSTSLSDLAFDVPTLIAYISTVTQLLPWDVIATGTPGGVGLSASRSCL